MGALLSLFQLLLAGDRGVAFLSHLQREHEEHQRREATTNTNNANANNTAANARPIRSGLGSLLRWMARGAAVAPPPAPAACPICLEKMATFKSKKTPTPTIQLARCVHTFCHDCIHPYVERKVRERLVEWDQLQCPVVECKRSLNDRDLMNILNRDGFAQYKHTLQRVRDEKNPLARWCINPQCGELMVCEANTTRFTCPKCAVVGCFYCRGPAHCFAFLCRRATTSEDASYTKWLQSVGDRRTVRACPQCHIRIWKTEGCNHMTCARCHHAYCWVCDADWHHAHYACVDAAAAATTLGDGVRRVLLSCYMAVCGGGAFWTLAAMVVLGSLALTPYHWWRQHSN